MSARALFSALFALFSAVMLGLAFGAVWMVPTLFFQHVLPWLALAVGWVLGWMIRGWVKSSPTDRPRTMRRSRCHSISDLSITLERWS